MARPGVPSTVIDQLREAATPDKKGFAKLLGRDQEFAMSLVNQWDRTGSLSDKQIPWVFTLLERAEDSAGTTGTMTPKKANHETVDIGAWGRVNEMFDKARERTPQHEYPYFTFLCDGVKLRMSQKKPGMVYNLTHWNEGAGKTDWYGAVSPAGILSLGRFTRAPETLIQTLKEFSADPSAAASKHGKLMRCCCFCKTKLTSEDSRYYGYGPICAGKWGLEWGEAKTHKRQENIALAIKEMEESKL